MAKQRAPGGQWSSQLLDITPDSTVARCLDCDYRAVDRDTDIAIHDLTRHVQRTHGSSERRTYMALKSRERRSRA